MADDLEIRAAVERDLGQIETWLRRELRAGEGFYNNIGMIRAGVQMGTLLVAAGATGVAGFTLGLIDILEVRPGLRRRGVGRRLVEHCLNRARACGMFGLRIQCMPHSSVPFWKHMGFVVLPEEGAMIHAVRSLAGRQELPPSAMRVKVDIDLLDTRTGEPLVPHFASEAAVDTDVGLVLRDEYVQFYGRDYGALLNVMIDGRTVWNERVDESSKIGADREAGFVAIRALRLPPGESQHARR
jgi:GNAT superfamily N-acetyltransferase